MIVGVEDVVLPGDVVEEICLGNKCVPQIVIGPGLRVHHNQVFVLKGGILKKKITKDAQAYFVDCFHQKRYVPARGETVLGVITSKSGDIFKVDIGSSEQAAISYLAFEGATKKNRPDLQVGDVIFAQLVIASRDMEPELVCINSYGKKGKLGQLQEGGFVFTCSLNLVRKILKQSCPLLRCVGKHVSCETAIGMNGKIWIKAESVERTIAVFNAILAAEHMSNNEIEIMCRELANIR